MPIIRIDLDAKTFARLAEIAIEESRPIPWQAEVLLRRMLGTMSTATTGPYEGLAATAPHDGGEVHGAA
jgi:hypothetical protein